MAINDSHFKEAINIPKTSPAFELPSELMYVAGGVLVLFVIGAIIFWRRIGREEAAAES